MAKKQKKVIPKKTSKPKKIDDSMVEEIYEDEVEVTNPVTGKKHKQKIKVVRYKPRKLSDYSPIASSDPLSSLDEGVSDILVTDEGDNNA